MKQPRGFLTLSRRAFLALDEWCERNGVPKSAVVEIHAARAIGMPLTELSESVQRWIPNVPERADAAPPPEPEPPPEEPKRRTPIATPGKRAVSDRTLAQMLERRLGGVRAFQVFMRRLGPGDVFYASAMAFGADDNIVEAKASAMAAEDALVQLLANLDQATASEDL
jgi:hypothetical protein